MALSTPFQQRVQKLATVFSVRYSSRRIDPKANFDSSRRRGPQKEGDFFYRVTRELSYLLRHGALHERVPIRPDGYVNVDTLLKHPPMRGLGLNELRRIVSQDNKSRYNLRREIVDGVGSWWIRANQGHSMPGITPELEPIMSSKDIPMAVHGTTLAAWTLISKSGLSRMTRNHIHLAQGYVGSVISGMRKSSQILVFIDVSKALEAGIPFFLSSNGVVLTPGDSDGYLQPNFFSNVRYANPTKLADPVPGWTALPRATRTSPTH
ncbi:tRNA phosphotransferase 1 [Mycena indigotica]|uniref:2'-phosphotransferase n=1 Tax=Mycena indigotica TaxID=2126181 RepID=A0A8H6T004_9AGAR|nr:tRNA phosphotransferase 1 [Mycena indigotica]KAF7309440.1 tRNA phosphotransferase 1 [Mycena indigotica]